MIYRLQRKFILICVVSVVVVISLVWVLIAAFNLTTMNKNLDVLADSVSEGGGRFPDRFHNLPPPKDDERGGESFDFITPETPFSTRHFTVWFDSAGNIARINMESIHSVTEQSATEMANETLSANKERGWTSNYRYKVFSGEEGKAIVFIDGSMSRSNALQSITISALVLLGCGGLVIILVLLLSKRVVKPIAKTYEKQKQFITDANHELKTPLTLILANLDIAEAELGENEWLDDIRSESYRMTELVNQLVALSRLDEEEQRLNTCEIPFGEIVCDTAEEFKTLAESKGKTFKSQIDSSVRCVGDEMLLRRMLSVLFDNAVKYCDDGGNIRVSLVKRRQIVLDVENTYSSVDATELDRLFDRFYRADKSRRFNGGYGIGLSIAKGIVEAHRGEISAYKKDASHIGFKVVL